MYFNTRIPNSIHLLRKWMKKKIVHLYCICKKIWLSISPKDDAQVVVPTVSRNFTAQASALIKPEHAIKVNYLMVIQFSAEWKCEKKFIDEPWNSNLGRNFKCATAVPEKIQNWGQTIFVVVCKSCKSYYIVDFRLRIFG